MSRKPKLSVLVAHHSRLKELISACRIIQHPSSSLLIWVKLNLLINLRPHWMLSYQLSSGHDQTSLSREEVFLGLRKKTPIDQPRVRAAHNAVSSTLLCSFFWLKWCWAALISSLMMGDVCEPSLSFDIFLALHSDLLNTYLQRSDYTLRYKTHVKHVNLETTFTFPWKPVLG